MSISLSIVVFILPLIGCLLICWLVGELLREFLASGKQLIVATILAALTILHLVIAGPFEYRAQWGFYSLLPGIGLVLLVLPEIGNIVNIRSNKLLPLEVWSAVGVLLLVVPLVMWMVR
ncbi:hypothetical protein H0A36_05155 [Endozoicomonas sp. SM1973]|uniref:Uncharacterized protein n=1 Tax=Spartinivicinus marinus TaxID=2994442 RepID=A0A853HYF0_9GAMM|nr:hypothetical protein [Spartinivicinus marinus]MCX4029027.1 hypothetical protein [Spartinivicinus marinus]NYZ65389.1 hypothetical protein [Spartinivicinus marinus]